MKPIVFLGPTLPRAEAERELDAIYLPPAVQGDVYRAALDRPPAILLVDGRFEQAPAVAHKEILWAMSEGVHVFGAASMGALRAAELHPFGMEGVGAIFEAFRDGALTDDDEVAVAHTDAEGGHLRLSEAMVDIRATLARALEQGLVTAEQTATLVRCAKRRFYTERCWPLVLADAAGAGIPADATAALRDFVRGGALSQKREDALLALRLVRERLSTPQPPKRVDYTFERTDAWEHIAAQARKKPGTSGAGDVSGALLPALAASGELGPMMEGALIRALAIDWAAQRHRAAEGAVLRDAVESFRRAHGLFRPEDTLRWLADNEVRDPERFWKDEAQVAFVRAALHEAALRALPDHLRSLGRYADVKAAAERVGGRDTN